MCELRTGRFISNNRALRPASSLEVGAMPSSSFQRALQRQINFLRFLDSLPATLRCLWNSSILFNKFSFEEHVVTLKCFSWVEMGFPLGGRGGEYSWEFLEGLCGPVLQILILWVYFLFNWNQLTNMFRHYRRSLENNTWFQTKMGKVYTRFQTKTTQNPYPLGRHLPISWLI